MGVFCVDRPIDRPTDATDDRHARARSARTTRETEARRTRFPRLLVSTHTLDRHRVRRERRSNAPSRPSVIIIMPEKSAAAASTTRRRAREDEDETTDERESRKKFARAGEEPETHRSEIHGRGERIALHSTVGVEA